MAGVRWLLASHEPSSAAAQSPPQDLVARPGTPHRGLPARAARQQDLLGQDVRWAWPTAPGHLKQRLSSHDDADRLPLVLCRYFRRRRLRVVPDVAIQAEDPPRRDGIERQVLHRLRLQDAAPNPPALLLHRTLALCQLCPSASSAAGPRGCNDRRRSDSDSALVSLALSALNPSGPAD